MLPEFIRIWKEVAFPFLPWPTLQMSCVSSTFRFLIAVFSFSVTLSSTFIRSNFFCHIILFLKEKYPQSGLLPSKDSPSPLFPVCLQGWCQFSFILLPPGLSWWFSGKESVFNAGDMASIPPSGRFSGEGNGNPLQYSCLENPMNRGAWWARVHRVAESDTTERLNNFPQKGSTKEPWTWGQTEVCIVLCALGR